METINDFLSTYAKKSTKIAMRSGLYLFLEYLGNAKRKGAMANPREMKQFEKNMKEYWAKKPNYYKDMLKFATWLNESNKPPHTARTYLSSVKEYFSCNEIIFTEHQLKSIHNKLPKGNARTEEADMTKEVIGKILEYTDVRGRALFLVLISTGMRIGECLKLLDTDLAEYFGIKNKLVQIRGQYTKTGNSRYAFLNKEAIAALDAYLKVRTRYLKAMMNRNGRSKTKKRMDDPRIFPFSDTVALEIFTNALEKAGISNFSGSVHRKTFRIHQFRKYFRSQLALGCPIDIVEVLMGHNGYLTTSYRRFTKEQVYENYIKNEHLLYINECRGMEHLESEYLTKLEAYNKENAKLKLDIERMKMEDEMPDDAILEFMMDEKKLRWLHEQFKKFEREK